MSDLRQVLIQAIKDEAKESVGWAEVQGRATPDEPILMDIDCQVNIDNIVRKIKEAL